MANLSVQIVRFVDAAFPGWVECEFFDAQGRLHVVRDKAPIFTKEVLDESSVYPCSGEIACEILGTDNGDGGRQTVRITIERPFGVESIEGATAFVVSRELLR